MLGPNHPDCATCLSNLARLYENRGEFALADPLALEALEITERHLELTSNVQSERQQLLMNQSVRSYLDTYLSISAETAPPADQVHGEVLRWKGAVWARQQSLRHWRQALADDPNLSDDEKKQQPRHAGRPGNRLAATGHAQPRHSLARASRGISPADRRSERQDRIAATRTGPAQRRFPYGPDPRADRFGHDRPMPARRHGAGRSDRILALLPLARFAGQRDLAAAVGGVRACGPISRCVRLELGSVTDIRDAVVSWREHFAREHHDPDGETQAVADPAGVLRRMVWERLVGTLGETKTVLISPDGVLSQLPWAALPGSKPDTYLLEEGFAFAIVPVPRLLPELLATHARPIDTAKNPALALVGDVDYGAAAGRLAPRSDDPAASRWRCGRPRARTASQPWPKLDATRMEILAVQDSFSNADPDERSQSLRKAKATEERVRAAGSQMPLHALRHARLFCRRPAQRSTTAAESRADVRNLHPGLLSGLVLAGANQPVDPEHDDGILTALEVEELDLSGMELATLSACQTGLGKSISGEGPWDCSGPSRSPVPAPWWPACGWSRTRPAGN